MPAIPRVSPVSPASEGVSWEVLVAIALERVAAAEAAAAATAVVSGSPVTDGQLETGLGIRAEPLGPGDVSAQLSENAARAVTAGRGVAVDDGAYAEVLPVRTKHWLAELTEWADTQECRDAARTARVGMKNVLRVAADEADHADYDTGRELRTSHRSVAARLDLGWETVHRARWFLKITGWQLEIERGRPLRAAERAAARARHGRHQTMGGSVRALTTPRLRELQEARAKAAAGRQRARYERLKRAMGASVCWVSSHQPRSGQVREHLQRSSGTKARKRARAQSAKARVEQDRFSGRAHHLAGKLLASLPTGAQRRDARHLGHLVAAVAPLADQGWSHTEVLRVIDAYDRDHDLPPTPSDQQNRPVGLLIHRITRACAPDKRPGQGRQGVQPAVPAPEQRTTGVPATSSTTYVDYRTTRSRPITPRQDRHQRLIAAARLSSHELRSAQAACPDTTEEEELSRDAFVALVEQLDPRTSHRTERS